MSYLNVSIKRFKSYHYEIEFKMKKRVLQLFIVALLLLSLLVFDYSLNKQQLPSAIPVTGAVVSESQTALCAEASPCKSPTSWKCQSNSKCYDYSDCVFQCPSTPSSEKKEEQSPDQACTCGDWQTTGGCGEQSCPSGKLPQSRSCTGGSTCKSETRCLESSTCTSSTPSETKTSEGAKEGVNLAPELVVAPQEGLKGGDTMHVIFYVKNTGTKSTNAEDVLKRCNTATTNCKISTTLDIGIQSGSTLTPLIEQTAYKDINPLFYPATQEIKPGDAGKLEVARKTVTIPESSQGNVVITATVTPQSGVEDAGNLGDNRKTVTLAVEGLGLPNLVATAAEVSPRIEAFPATIQSVAITIKNTGERSVVAKNQFLENKVTIKKEDAEFCKGESRNLIDEPGIKKDETRDFPATIKSITGTPCVLDDGKANYRAIVEVDSSGIIQESSEENTFTFVIKEQPKCEIGTRQAGRYCNLATGTWLTQKEAGQQCSHNFECQTELCIKQKCVSEKQKEDILKLLGIV